MNTQAQTLFTFGKKVATKEEFVRAFNKNPGLEPDRKKALKEYLDLYINFKLKVQAAYDAKLQEDPNYLYETENFRKQLAQNFINEEANIKALVREAFERSQKDIHLRQVFIELPASNDTTQISRKINDAYSQLRNGKSFDKVAAEYSSDPGYIELGHVTVFTLPYVFENIIYKLKPNTYSAPVRSASGYHIFYNAGERPAVGRRKAAQILFAIPPGAAASEKAMIKNKADSVYRVLLADPRKFDEMVHAYSNDAVSARDHGLMQEFGVSQYTPAFDAAVFALRKPGELTHPVETEFGYHIIQLREIIPVGRSADDPVVAAGFKTNIEKDNRLVEAKKSLVSKWMKLAKYKPAVFDEKELWAYTDSAYQGGKTNGFRKITDATVLFTFEKQKVTASDFAKYFRSVRHVPMYAAMSHSELFKEYTKAAATDYYQSHLEEFNADFRNQMNEFNEANLLFAIMDREVWSKAAIDDAGLREHYEQNKAKYRWDPSADAIIFTVPDEGTLVELQQRLSGNMQSWRAIAGGYENRVLADSNRYELSQIPVVDRTAFTADLTTAPVKNNDGSYTFSYIIRVYPGTAQRSFTEARGLVTNDYQAVLEQRWIADLKKKYPVKVNQSVFNTIK
jgi:peptidyl-prolyl cis-trans isomerase SurA